MISHFNCIAKFFFKYLDLQDLFLFFFFLKRSVVKIRKGAKKDGKFGWLSKRLDKSIKQLSSGAFEPTKIAPVQPFPWNIVLHAILSARTDKRFICGDRITLVNRRRKKIVLLNQRLPVFVLHWKLSCVSKNMRFTLIYKIDSLNERLCFHHIGM